MRKTFTIRFLVLFFFTTVALSAEAVTLYTYTNGGSTGQWNVAATWTTDPSGVTLTGSAVPGNNDVVHILNGFTVTLAANVTTTGLTINIHNGGTLNLSTFTMSTISTLTGSGTLRIKAGYFPTITTNSFLSNYASGATVEFYDFSGTLPVSVNYPNLTFTNSTASNYTIAFSNASAYSFTIYGNLVTRTTGTGNLSVLLGTQITNIINLTVNGNVTIGANTTLGVGAFNAIHTVTLNSNMTNNGTVDFSNSAQYTASTNGAATITFTGATDNILACNGVTDFYTLTVNKGLSSTNILSVTSTNTANLNLYSSGQLIMISNGTLKLGSNINIPRVYGSGTSNYDIGSSTQSPMLWIDGATVNTNGAALVVYGKIRISAGSFTSVGGQGTVIREEGQYIIEGGTFTTEKFRPSTTATTHRGSFTMTGGIFNASGTTASDSRYARFSLPFPEQVFIMSGGTINVSNPEASTSSGDAVYGGIHIGCNTSNYNVTGGTVNAILSGSASFFNIATVAPFWDFNITRTGGTPTTVRLAGIGSVGGTVTTAQPLVVLNDFTINGTNTPVFNANGLNVTIGGDFAINSGGTYTPNANTTTFNGSADQIFSNDGTITSGLYNLTVDKAAGTLTLSGSATTYTVTQMLTLLGGILNDGGKTLQVTGNIYNEASHTGTGNITLAGSTTQTVSGDGTGIFGNLILNNASVPGVTATSDLAVSGILTLAGTSNSLFDIAHYRLSLTSTSATALTTTGNGFSSTKMIRTSGYQSDRGVQKTYGNLSAFTFAFGVGSNYTPATIQLTTAPSVYGTITARPVNSRHQFIVAANTNNLTWYWKVVSSGFTGIGATGVSHNYQYVESSVSPANDDANYVPARYNPTNWTVLNNTSFVNEGTNIISFSNVSYIDGDFTAGIPASFGTVKIFYSKRSGNWDDAGAGTTPWSNVSHTGPDATTIPGDGDQVFIGDGVTYNHTITITSNNRSSGGLEINSGSTLDLGIYTGHNFGRLENVPISGSGLLRISSATATAEFPAGDFGNFIRANGGTVEYYTTGTQDFTIPTGSSVPTSLPLISYKNLVLKPASGQYIAMPNQDERIYGNITVQGASSTGVARLNAAASRTLTVNGNVVVTSGNLQFMNGTAQTLEVDGNVTISAGAIVNLASNGSAAVNILTIEGNLVNNGTLDLSNTASYVCNAIFTGTANTSITGTGSVTDFNILTVSKGTSQTPVLDVNASAFTLSGATLPLVLNYGTFRLSSAQTVTIATSADFSIPSTARLSANGGTLQTTGGDGHDLLLAGTLEILSGTVNIGTTANDNAIEYAATGQPTIAASGGTLNVKAQIRRSFASSQGALIYNQSGASIVSVGRDNATVTTRGVFEILNTGSSFTMSGGTLQIVRTSGSTSIADLYLQPASYSVTGGTVEIGTGATSQTVDINSIIPVYNVTVTGTTNAARLEYNPLTLYGSLTINSGNIFNANTLNVSIAGNFVNANATSTTGTTVGGFQAGSVSQTTTLNGSSSNQTITGTSGNLTNFGNLVINNTFPGGSVALQANTNLQVNGILMLSSGILAGGANTITAISTVSNSSTHTSTSGGSITLAGTSAQTITGNGSGKFGDVILNNTAGAAFGANQEITGTLTFTNGALTIGTYGLVLSNTSLTSIVNATTTKYIITSGRLSDGGITKAFSGSLASAGFIFPIGVSGKYTQADYTISTGTAGGTITIKPVNSKHPSATGSGTSYINYYWSVSHTIANLTALTHKYTYVAADQSGAPGNYRDARFSGGAWTIGVTAGNPNTTTRVITFTNITDLTGDYTAGQATAFVNPTTYTSIASGNWESDAAVWDIDPPGTNIGPPAGSFVIISEGHTVTVTSNAKRMATLEVRGRLHLGTTTGHDYGTVTTSGAGARTIQIQSSTFPTGNFTSFTAANGGTVEYDGAVTLPTQSTYNNIAFTSAGTKTLSNVDLTINGNLTVDAGTVTNAVSNRDITLASTTGDFTNRGTFVTGAGTIIIGRNFTNTGASASFTAGSGTGGLRIAGNFTNSTNATFTASTDSIGVRGSLTNSATFTASSGAIRVTGNLNNTGGTFTAGSGTVTISGSLINNAVYAAGSGATTVRGSYTNSGIGAVHQANANALTINGSFTNTLSAIFNAGSGSVAVAGNWNNSGTFSPATSSVTFTGASSQTLTGNTTFNNLTRSNGGSLTVNNDIVVAGSLTLTSGNVATGSNMVRVTNTATQSVSGSASSFIDGILAISYPNTAGASRIFPIGKGSIYRPVTIQQTAASTAPVVSVEMVNSPPSGSYPSSIEGLSPARYYAITQVSGTMNSPTVELSFNTNSPTDEPIAVPGNARVVRATASSGPWTDEGGAGVYSPASPSGYATSGVTSFASPTYFALGFKNQVLPITLKSFDAKLKGDVVLLNWVTYTEINNAYFTIERSADGIHYDSIGFEEGAGYSAAVLSYQQTDYRPLYGVSYYRLKQTDFDGRYSHSNVVRIENTNSKGSSMVVYPNPSQLSGKLMVRVNADQVTGIYMVITHVSGRTIFSDYVTLNEDLEIDLYNLDSGYALERGVYFVSITSGGLKETQKLIIH
ncbi:T9SS type A sorting domain-containing protein [Ohtaekwangia kribbensis]|uniref:T9SS type A sorting domain-containing protein n=1 Tax=Ohtaekwangia kribbensis TaxID=688913 RepID=A0ABW3KBJ2_9BACT